jgi:hypothetical protein
LDVGLVSPWWVAVIALVVISAVFVGIFLLYRVIDTHFGTVNQTTSRYFLFTEGPGSMAPQHSGSAADRATTRPGIES